MQLSKQQKAWAYYDVGNSSYQLVIVTAIFPIYYAAVCPENISLFGSVWSKASFYLMLFSMSYLFIGIANPLLSGIADFSMARKKFMIGFTITGIIGTLMLCLFDSNHLEIGFMGTFLSTVGYAGSMVFYNAYLPEIAKEEDQDLLSARGYAWGYLSSMILLVIALIPFVFGLLDSELASKLTFLLVSIWWAFFSFYSISRLPKDALSIKSNRNMIVGGYIELFSAMKKVYSQKRLSLFLASFFFYMMGVQTVFYAATLFGKQELKLDDNLLIVTMLLIQLLGAIGANVLSKLARHKGNFIALSITIVIWAGVTVFAYLMQSAVEFIIASIFVGFVMGGIQSLSRSTYSKWTYKLKDKASLFSLLDFTEKIGIVIGTMAFAYFTDLFGSMREAILLLAGFFLVGLILLICSNQLKSAS